MLRDVARHLLVHADLQRQPRPQLSHAAVRERTHPRRRRGVRHANGLLAGQVGLRVQHLVRVLRRPLEHLVDQLESAAPVHFGDEGKTRHVRQRQLLADDRRRLEQLRGVPSGVSELLRGHAARGGRGRVQRELHRPAGAPRAHRDHGGHRVALVESHPRQPRVVVRKLLHVREPEVLVLQGVLDLVREHQLEGVG